MTVETTIRLDETQRAFLETEVEKGRYASLDAAIAEAVDRMQDALAPQVTVDEIRRRMQTPNEEFIPWDGDKMMEEVRAGLRERYGDYK